MRAGWLACSLLALVAGHARADDVPPAPDPVPPPAEPSEPPAPEPLPVPAGDGPVLKAPVRTREIIVDVPGERSRNNKLILASATALGALVGALGLYYHLDSRDAANEVTASTFTGRAWTPADDLLVEQAERSRTRAAIAYSVGGALVTAAIVGFIFTEPKSERAVIRPHAQATLAPTQGGAMVGGVWRW